MKLRDVRLLAALLVIVTTAAHAQAPRTQRGDAPRRAEQQRPAEAGEDRASRLERLYDRLGRARTASEARRFASSIDQLRLRSGSDTADLLARRALEAIGRKETDAAIELLGAVVDLQPDFAEAWNRRATVFFLKGDYGRSMRDIRETLAREPRHWGAWAGLGRILEETGDKPRALAAYRRALAVHPFLEGLKEKTERLATEVRGRDI